MNRPLFLTGVSFFIATRLAFFFSESPLKMSLAALVTAVLFFLFRQNFKYAYNLCIIMLTASVAFASFFLHDLRETRPLNNLSGKTVTVEGLITEVEPGIRSITYTMRADFPEYGGTRSTTLIVRGFSNMEYSAGDSVRMRVKLVSAGDSNWYRSRGILLIGQSPSETQRLPEGKYRYERALLRLRAIFSRNVYANLREENADIVSAMVLGIKSNLSPQVYSAVGRSGTSHLLSVSGLHLSILSAVALALLKKLRCPKALSALIAILFSFFFSAMVGFNPSVIRAFVMTAVTLVSDPVFSRRNDSMSSLGLALLVCAIVFPNWALGWGLWLSAGSTLGIIMFTPKLNAFFAGYFKRGGKILRYFGALITNGLAISIAAYTFTIPVLLLMSGWISLVSPLANILITPFVPIAILGGSLCAIFPADSLPIKLVAAAADLSTAVIVKTSEILGKLPFATIAIDEAWILLLLVTICVIVILMVILRQDMDKKLIVYAVALIVTFYSLGDLSLAIANRGKTELVTLESQNAAMLIRDNEAVILGTPDAYEISNLLKYLTFRGIERIPVLVANDATDTVGSGLLRLAAAYEIDCVIAPDDAYIMEVLSKALPESQVFSGGYAEITALGNTAIKPDKTGTDVHIIIGRNEIVKIRRECDIIVSDNKIRIYDDGVMVMPVHTAPLYEPVGGYLFGESRVLLKG